MSSLPSSTVLSVLDHLLTSGFIPSLDLDSDVALAQWAESSKASLRNIEHSADAASKETTNPELILCEFVAKLTSHLELRGYPVSSFLEDEESNQIDSERNRNKSQENDSRPSSASAKTTSSGAPVSILKKSSDQQQQQNENENNSATEGGENSDSNSKLTKKNSSSPIPLNHFAIVRGTLPVKGGAQLLRHGNDVARVSRMAQRLAEEVADLQQAKLRMMSQHAQELNQQAASYREIISELLEQQAKLERQLSDEMQRNRHAMVAKQ